METREQKRLKIVKRRYEAHKNHWLVQSVKANGDVEDHEMFLPNEKHWADKLADDLRDEGFKSVRVVHPSIESFGG